MGDGSPIIKDVTISPVIGDKSVPLRKCPVARMSLRHPSTGPRNGLMLGLAGRKPAQVFTKTASFMAGTMVVAMS